MKLSEFIKQLSALEAQGHGDLVVYYRHGSSGDCGRLSSARLAHVNVDGDEQGPFDVKGHFIFVYAGN
jgi:hypothetical protein